MSTYRLTDSFFVNFAIHAPRELSCKVGGHGLHPYSLIALPIIGAAIVWPFAIWVVGPDQAEKDKVPRVAVAAGASCSVFFAVQFSLFAFVGGHGSSGPVQYTGGESEAMTLFWYRGLLVLFTFVLAPLVLLMNFSVSIVVAVGKQWLHSAVAFLSGCIQAFACYLAFSDFGWIPTA